MSDHTWAATWQRLTSQAGWAPPQVLHLLEGAAWGETAQPLVEGRLRRQAVRDWLVVAHVPESVTGDVAAVPPRPPVAWHAAPTAQDGLW